MIVVVEGASPKPVYLSIRDGEVEDQLFERKVRRTK